MPKWWNTTSSNLNHSRPKNVTFHYYFFFPKFQSWGPLRSIWTYKTNFPLRIKWGLWKNVFCFIIGPIRGGLGGINRFDPLIFWLFFAQFCFQSSFWRGEGGNYRFLRTKSRILRCTFFSEIVQAFQSYIILEVLGWFGVGRGVGK